MGKITGFLEIERQDRSSEKPELRINNYLEFVRPLPAPEVAPGVAATLALALLLIRRRVGLPLACPDVR